MYGYGSTDEEALADLWPMVQSAAKHRKEKAQDALAMFRQRNLEAQGAEQDIIASIAEIDRIMAEESGS